jgi:hypothetical protein
VASSQTAELLRGRHTICEVDKQGEDTPHDQDRLEVSGMAVDYVLSPTSHRYVAVIAALRTRRLWPQPWRSADHDLPTIPHHRALCRFVGAHEVVHMAPRLSTGRDLLLSSHLLAATLGV